MFYHIHQTIYFERTLTLQDVWGDATRPTTFSLFSIYISEKMRIFRQKWVPLGEYQVTLCQS